MADKFYVVAVTMTIPADSYAEAVATATAVVDTMSDTAQGIEVVTDYEYDNDGQRVLYLHPENEPGE